MSDHRLNVEYERYRASAGGFDEIADKLNRLHRRLNARLQAEGTCWGSDETGNTFAEGYVPTAAGAVTTLDGLATGVARVAENVRATAETYRATEHRFQGRISGIGGM